MRKILTSAIIFIFALTTTVTPVLPGINGIGSVRVFASYSENGISIDDCVSWIKGTTHSVNVTKPGVNSSDWRSQFAAEMYMAQLMRELESYLRSLERRVLNSGQGVTNEIVTAIHGAKLAVEGVNVTGVEKVNEALQSIITNLNITFSEENIIGEIELRGFSDLGNHQWAKEAIEDMSIGEYKGLFSGTTKPDIYGYAQFSPAKAMTRAEFITVAVRALYPEQLTQTPGEVWYKSSYDVAVNNGLIKTNEYSFSDEILNAPIQRQEAALILVRALDKKEKFYLKAGGITIADYDLIDEPYKEAVKRAFESGLMQGRDDAGNFAPYETLTRAEASTVLYRLVNPEKRNELLMKSDVIILGQ